MAKASLIAVEQCQRLGETRGPGHLPSSGQLTGTLVEILGLSQGHEDLRDSTARRWFKGEKIRPSNQARILRSVDASHRAEFGESSKLGWFMAEARLTAAVAAWDGVHGTVSSLSQSLESSGGPWAIPVFIVRGHIAARVRSCLPSRDADAGPFNRLDGIGSLLRRLKEAGDRAISREELAGVLGSSRNTVDAWLDKGTLPKPAQIKKLARFFGRHVRECEQALAVEFRYRCAIARLKKRLSSWSRR